MLYAVLHLADPIAILYANSASGRGVLDNVQ